jgi:hypothetical protein
MALKLRTRSPEAHETIEQCTPARTAAARLVERARRVLLAHHGPRVPALAPQRQRTARTGRTWRKRFNAAGLAALTDKQRLERPATDTPPQVAAVSAPALPPPEPWGLPCASWPLARLEAYGHEHQAMAIPRSRMADRLLAAGRRWRPQATGCGARGDPACAQTRGAVRHSLRPRLPGGSCSAWPQWARQRPRASPGRHACARLLPPRHRPLPRGPVKRARRAGAVRAPSGEPCVLSRVRPFRRPTPDGLWPMGSPLGSVSLPGSPRRRSQALPFWPISTGLVPPTSGCVPWPSLAGRWSSSPPPRPRST